MIKNFRQSFSKAACGVISATAIIATSAACSFTDPGEGTGGLDVAASITYKTFERSEIRLSIRDANGNAVEGAVVKIYPIGHPTGEEAGIDIHEQTNGNFPYSRNIDGYYRRIKLTISAGGTGRLEAALEGPGPFTIASPNNNIILDAQQDPTIELRWATEDGIRADEIHVEFGRFEVTQSEDLGRLEIPLSSVGNGQHELKLSRTNFVPLDGGIFGSKLSMTYRIDNEAEVVGN